MIGILIRHTFILLLSFLGVTCVFFSLTQLLPEQLTLLPVSSQSVETNWIVQYFNYVNSILHGDLGTSLTNQQPVLDQFIKLFPATLELSLAAAFIAVVIGVTIGTIAALKKNSWIDDLVISTSLIGYSMPVFWWGMLLILLFSLTLGITPVAGRISFVFDVTPVTGAILIDSLLAYEKYGFAAFINATNHLILPSIVLATVPLAVIARMTRSSMIDVFHSEYILTARAKGLSMPRIIFVHGLRNALIPVLTVLGLQVSILLSGTLLTEIIFAWPGVGKWLVEAIFRRDFPVIHGGVLLIAILVIIINTTIDLLYNFVNPRLRYPNE